MVVDAPLSLYHILQQTIYSLACLLERCNTGRLQGPADEIENKGHFEDVLPRLRLRNRNRCSRYVGQFWNGWKLAESYNTLLDVKSNRALKKRVLYFAPAVAPAFAPRGARLMTLCSRR